MLITAGLLFGVYIAVRYFWPVLLIIAAYIGFQVYRIRKQLRNTEAEMRQTLNETVSEKDVIRKPQPEAEIIDAEFTVKNRDQQEMHG